MGIDLDGRTLRSLAIFRQAASDFAEPLAHLTDDQRIRRIAKLLIDLDVSDAIGQRATSLRDAGVRLLDDVRRPPAADFPRPTTCGRRRRTSQFCMNRVYRHYRVARMTTKAEAIHRQDFRGLQVEPRHAAADLPRSADEEGLEHPIADYIAGMTDRFAQDEYQRLYEPFERV